MTKPSASTLFKVGLLGRCPRCGQGALFDGFLTLRKECAHCHLDYGFINTGDGPAVFVIMIAGFIVLGAALWAQIVYEPPFWLYLAIILPFSCAICLGLLRPAKAFFAAMQYFYKAK